MRIAAFRAAGDPYTGMVVDDRVHPFPGGTTALTVLSAPPDEREQLAHAAATHDGWALTDVTLDVPIEPPSMRDFLTFEAHVAGVNRAMTGEDLAPEWYEAPSFLFMSPHAVTATGVDVAKPHGTERLDFELELAAVVCRDARDVSPADAAGCIGGYLIMNDWSARDIQQREMRLGLGPSKGKDFATTIGPWIVTSDELAPYVQAGRLDLEMTVSVNGVRVGGDRSAHMGWSFEQMLSYASRGAWVRAGDVLASGTCAGGALAESWGRLGRLEPAPLEAGDVVTMAIEGIGEISNRVVPATYPDIAVAPARRTTS